MNEDGVCEYDDTPEPDFEAMWEAREEASRTNRVDEVAWAGDAYAERLYYGDVA